MKKEDSIKIKELSVSARQEGFLEDYKKMAAKWGIDFQPAYRIVDLFAINAEQTQLEGVEEVEEIEKPEISNE